MHRAFRHPFHRTTWHSGWASAWRSFLLVVMVGWVVLVAPARADQAEPAGASSAGSTLEPSDNGVPVVVWNRTVAVLHAPLRGMSAVQRAQGANERIDRIVDTLTPEEISADWTQSGNDGGMAIRAANQSLFGVLPGDTPEGTQAAAEQEGARAAERLRQVLVERAAADHPAMVVRGIGFTLLASLILVVVGWTLTRTNRFVQERLERIAEARLKLDLGGFDLRPVIWGLLRRLIGLIKFALMLFFVYLWLSFVLRLFPYSRPWGQQLGEYLVELGARIAAALVNQIPNLITLAVIFVIARGAVRLLTSWFDGIERGSVKVSWLEPPAAGVTRRLLSLGVWLFALIVAYPYIPGAGTDAFKGVSVFLGLMLSLGSAGVVNQAVSGLVVLYSRAIRTGDFVKVGEHQGVVQEMGTLSMKLLTRTKLEITVPNSVLSSNPVCNYTRQSRDTGFLLTTSVTIGYDTPWRQVVALLELAAARTEGLLASRRPFVLQTALSDYYVEYQLNVALLNAPDQFVVLSELHKNIQDAFNEFGVQIMSPHFRTQPDDKVWVPSEHWYDAPAQAPGDKA